MDELADIAKQMRQYAFAHPMDPITMLQGTDDMKQYSQDFILEGYPLRATFTLVRIPAAGSEMAQLSLAEWPAKRHLPPDLVDRVRDAFFDPADILTTMSAKQRNIAAFVIGRDPIADDNTEHFICRNPRRPEP